MEIPDLEQRLEKVSAEKVSFVFDRKQINSLKHILNMVGWPNDGLIEAIVECDKDTFRKVENMDFVIPDTYEVSENGF